MRACSARCASLAASVPGKLRQRPSGAARSAPSDSGASRPEQQTGRSQDRRRDRRAWAAWNCRRSRRRWRRRQHQRRGRPGRRSRRPARAPANTATSAIMDPGKPRTWRVSYAASRRPGWQPRSRRSRRARPRGGAADGRRAEWSGSTSSMRPKRDALTSRSISCALAMAAAACPAMPRPARSPRTKGRRSPGCPRRSVRQDARGG